MQAIEMRMRFAGAFLPLSLLVGAGEGDDGLEFVSGIELSLFFLF
jgi:hypothetical protein